jgi:hypothetical protein
MNSRQAIALIDSILSMVGTDTLTWEEQYNLVWKQAEPLSDWHDPDSSYEDDVLAYASHLRELREKAERHKEFELEANEPTLNITVRQALDSGCWSVFCDAMGLDSWRVPPSEGTPTQSAPTKCRCRRRDGYGAMT